MARWARYLRKAHVEFCPFQSRATAGALLDRLTSRSVKAESPKLAVTKMLLPRASSAPPQTTKFTFVDGSEQMFDISELNLSDIVEEIDLINGRIAQVEAERGKPFS